MRIIWQDEAERDLDRIAEYILKDDPAAALRLIYTLREATRVLSEHPNVGRIGRVEGTREFVISGLPIFCPIRLRVRRSGFWPLCTPRENGRIRFGKIGLPLSGLREFVASASLTMTPPLFSSPVKMGRLALCRTLPVAQDTIRFKLINTRR